MSRFFRSGNSTSSSSESSDEEEQDDAAQEVSLQPLETAHVGSSSTAATFTSHPANSHRDFLLSALLEDRCVREVVASYTVRGVVPPPQDSQEFKAEISRRYHRLCEQLASLNILPMGLEEDRHAVTRQRYRDGLDLISQQQTSSSTAVGQTLRRLLTAPETQSTGLPLVPLNFPMNQGPVVPYPLRRLLTAPIGYTGGFYDMDAETLRRQLPARFHQDFEETRTIGSGGYGIVYQCKHRLDGRHYAVKKVPLSQFRLDRIEERGQPELDEVLKELRTLAGLEHPNIVRYFSAWIEWVDVQPSAQLLPHFRSRESYAVTGADADYGSAAREVSVTSAMSNPEGAVIFEYSQSLPSSDNSGSRITSLGPDPTDHGGAALERVRTVSSRSRDLSEALSATHLGSSYGSPGYALQRVGTKSTAATVTDDDTIESVDRTLDPSFSMHSSTGVARFKEPMFAVHMQMSLHPMTLDKLLAPGNNSPSGTKHCFHLSPSITILLAILEGLAYLHKENIIHRDIKPGNIFLGNTNIVNGFVPCVSCHTRTFPKSTPPCIEVRIGDFGLASLEPTQHAHSVGTRTYLPPPEKKLIGKALDVYALGIVAFELLYKFDSMSERAEKIAKLKYGEFPGDFCWDVDHERRAEVKGYIKSMLEVGESNVSVESVRSMVSGLELAMESDEEEVKGRSTNSRNAFARTHEWRPRAGSWTREEDSD